MLVHLKLLPLVLVLLSSRINCNETETETKDDLMESESKDPTKVEIIKQIKRVNDDGSYTFGYEAEDGTFKIENRDVLGNVKGTFGFVDDNGEIKRVSYTTTNSTESATITSVDKDRSSVIQQIPKTNRTVSSTTRRPSYVTPSPTSTVIQSIPRRRISSSSNNNSSNNTTLSVSSSSSTERPSYKNVVKSNDFEITTPRSSSTTDSSVRSSTTIRPTGHYIRSSTISPQIDLQRFTEGQIIRPTQPDSITPRPTENYPRRLIITRPSYLDEHVSSTIRPIIEENGYDANVRSNLLRRQLNQEKVSNFDARQHVLNLQQSVGDDSTDVYSASLTTGTPRPLFTTTDRPRPFPTPTVSTAKGITPANYQPIYAKNLVRSAARSPSQNYIETTTDATSTDTNYVTPNSIPVVQIPTSEEAIPVVRARHPFHRGAILIPVNQIQNGRYIIDDSTDENQQPQYIQQYVVPADQQYVRDPNQNYVQQIPDPRLAQIPYQIVPRRRPIAVPFDDYQRQPVEPLFTPKQYPIPLPINPIDFQDEIDSIKPPVSTKDFQKLLNRLIIRQSQLQEISRIENGRMMHHAYVNPERYRSVVQQAPVSVFVRTRPDIRKNNGPVQFVGQSTNSRSRAYLPHSQAVPMQKLMESQQQYSAVDPYNSENYHAESAYRSGRRVARLLPNPRPKEEEDNNYLPADVREMLLLRMLQLAINPNLPIPPTEGETMASAIRQQHKKPSIRNVEILGEERDEPKPVARNKRYRESDEYEYY